MKMSKYFFVLVVTLFCLQNLAESEIIKSRSARSKINFSFKRSSSGKSSGGRSFTTHRTKVDHPIFTTRRSAITESRRQPGTTRSPPHPPGHPPFYPPSSGHHPPRLTHEPGHRSRRPIFVNVNTFPVYSRPRGYYLMGSPRKSKTDSTGYSVPIGMLTGLYGGYFWTLMYAPRGRTGTSSSEVFLMPSGTPNISPSTPAPSFPSSPNQQSSIPTPPPIIYQPQSESPSGYLTPAPERYFHQEPTTPLVQPAATPAPGVSWPPNHEPTLPPAPAGGITQSYQETQPSTPPSPNQPNNVAPAQPGADTSITYQEPRAPLVPIPNQPDSGLSAGYSATAPGGLVQQNQGNPTTPAIIQQQNPATATSAFPNTDLPLVQPGQNVCFHDKDIKRNGDVITITQLDRVVCLKVPHPDHYNTSAAWNNVAFSIWSTLTFAVFVSFSELVMSF